MIKPVNYKNLDFSKSYNPKYIHPEFKPYATRKETIDTINLIPEQIRKNKSFDFKPLGHTQTCPANFTAITDTSSGRNVIKCIYDRSKEVDRIQEAYKVKETPQSTFDMRSIDHNTLGGYLIFYKSKNAHTTQKYEKI